MTDVFFLNVNEGWIVGNRGLILHTINGGITWSIEGVGLTSSLLRGVHFTSSTNGYIVGNGITLLKYGLPLATEDETNIPKNFTLEQNYPNPFNPSTIIKYEISEIGDVSLNVYDILGNEVAEIVNSSQQPGEYQMEFDGSYLADGIYFYQLKTDSFIQTKKMLLLK